MSKKNKALHVANIAESLPTQPKDAVACICEAFSSWRQQRLDTQGSNEQGSNEERSENYGEYLGFFALLNMYLESLNLALDVPPLCGDKQKDIHQIEDFFATVRQRLAQMTLDLSLLANLNQDSTETLVTRFYQLTSQDRQTLSTHCLALHNWLSLSHTEQSARQILSEKYAIIQEQLEHDVLDLDLAWRFVSQFSITLDALTVDEKNADEKQRDKTSAIALLQSLSGDLCRVQAREEKLPDSTLKTILMKITNPARWEQESAASRREG